MSNSALLTFARVGLALAYVWAVRKVYLFMYTDGCLDAGGAVGAGGLCVAASPSHPPDLGATAPFAFWFALLTVPALFAWALYRLLTALTRRPSAGTTIEPAR